VSKLYRLSYRRLSAKLVPIVADGRRRVVSTTDPHGHILGFSRSEPLLFLRSSCSIVLTRLSGPVPDPVTVRKSGSAGNRTQTAGSVAWNSDQ
jgi:hypothetical protein